MKIGIAFSPADFSIMPDEMGRAVEDLGFDVLVTTEHTHIPVEVHSKKLVGTQDIPMEHRHLFDQNLWLAAAAMATKRITVGQGANMVAQHDPIDLARQVATLDRLAQGRTIFAFGYGWLEEEVANHGVDPSRRWGIAKEKVLAMKEIWTADTPSFSGKYVNFTAGYFGPQTYQSPHPPIFVAAGSTPLSLSHLAQFADGWLMRYGANPEGLARMKERVERAGRDPRTIRLAGHRTQPTPENLEYQESEGLEFVTLTVAPKSRDEVLRQLEELSQMVSAYRG